MEVCGALRRYVPMLCLLYLMDTLLAHTVRVSAPNCRLPCTHSLRCLPAAYLQMLGALASGRPLLTEKFIEASDAAGTFVDEDSFECRAIFPALLPAWRAPCFSKVCAVMLGAGDGKRVGLRRILQAGGATIVGNASATTSATSTSERIGLPSDGKTVQPVTHVIVPPGGERDLSTSEARQLRQFQRQGGSRAVMVIFHNMLIDFLTLSGGNKRADIGFDM